MMHVQIIEIDYIVYPQTHESMAFKNYMVKASIYSVHKNWEQWSNHWEWVEHHKK